MTAEIVLWVMLTFSSLNDGPEVFIKGFESKAECEQARALIIQTAPIFANQLAMPCMSYTNAPRAAKGIDI